MLRNSNNKAVIYDTAAPTGDTRLGQLFVDTDEVPPTLYICTSLSPVTFVPISGGGGGGGQQPIQFKDEGSNLGTAGTVDIADFVGAGVTATRIGNTLTITIPGGGGGGLPPDADYGDITVSGVGAVWTIDNGVVTLAKMAGLGANTFIGRQTGAGVPQELTATQATALLDVFTATDKGLAPLSGGGTTNFLRADGTWVAPPGGGGAFDVQQAIVTIPYGGSRGSAVVTDGTVSPSSLLLLGWGAVAETDENDPEMDDVSFFAVAGTGQFTVTATSATSGVIGGPFKINYSVG